MAEFKEVKKLPEIKEKFEMKLLFQVSITTPDMETMFENWGKLFKIDEATVVKRCTKDFYDRGEFDGANYYGKPCEFYIKYYRFDMGGIDMEIIEPLDKSSGNPYSDFLIRNGGQSGIQHVACTMDNRDRFIQTMEDIGIVPMQKGTMGAPMEDGFQKSFCFYDLLDYIGLIIEYGNVVVGPLANDPRAGNPEGYNMN
ncbi:MAG: VOC family protein [Suipraeoptans sp.]